MDEPDRADEVATNGTRADEVCAGEPLSMHLSQCEACRTFAAGIRRVDAALDSYVAPEPSWGFAARVINRINADARQSEQSVAPGRWFDILRPAPLGLGAAAFFLGVAVTMLADGGMLAERGADALGNTRLTTEATADWVALYTTLLGDSDPANTLFELLPEDLFGDADESYGKGG